MKQKNTWILGGTICIFLMLVTSQGAWGSISGTGHDFSVTGWAEGKICKPCHTPHHATNLEDAPLWNHELSSATYTLYNSPTMDVPVGQPGPVSKACLSCHDGTIALDSYGGNSGSNMIGGGALIGIDLSNDHPIGIDWGHQTVGTCTNCHVSVWDPDSSSFIMLPPVVQVYNGKIECASCHDAHNGANLRYLLRITMAGSTLCLTCHSDK
jgi:predicted CXXCH cytochrome family protein